MAEKEGSKMNVEMHTAADVLAVGEVKETEEAKVRGSEEAIVERSKAAKPKRRQKCRFFGSKKGACLRRYVTTLVF